MHLEDSASAVGLRVQVYNPRPGDTGTVKEVGRRPVLGGPRWVRVEWDDDGSETWSRADLLRPIEEETYGYICRRGTVSPLGY